MIYVRTKKKQKQRMKQFLVGRVFNFDVENVAINVELNGMKINVEKIVSMKISCNLEKERRKNFKLKFKRKKFKNRLSQLKEVFEISRKLEKKFAKENLRKEKMDMKRMGKEKELCDVSLCCHYKEAKRKIIKLKCRNLVIEFNQFVDFDIPGISIMCQGG
jgi:hypothetical protein